MIDMNVPTYSSVLVVAVRVTRHVTFHLFSADRQLGRDVSIRASDTYTRRLLLTQGGSCVPRCSRSGPPGVIFGSLFPVSMPCGFLKLPAYLVPVG